MLKKILGITLSVAVLFSEMCGYTRAEGITNEVTSESAYPRIEDTRPEQIIEYSFSGTVYYVSANGSENGNGTKQNPWNSVAYAASVVPGGQDAVIYVESGTYTEEKPIILKSGVNLIGEDTQNTILKTKDGVPGIRQEYGSENIVARFTLDGQGTTAPAISLYRSQDTVLKDLSLVTFADLGLVLHEVKDGDFYNLTMQNVGHAADLSGADCKFHDIVIDTYKEEPEIGWGIDLGTQSYAYRWDIHDVVVHIPFRGGWDAGNGYFPPSMAFESCAGNIQDIDVYNCDFNNTISLVPYLNKPEDTSIRFHNNILRLQTGETYGFEVAKQLTNCEIYENLIIGGSHLFSNWDGDSLDGLSVRRNVFDMITDNDDYWDMIGFLGTHYTDVSFDNNTFVLHKEPTRTRHEGVPLLFNIGDGPTNSMAYRNNILVYDNNGLDLPVEKNTLAAQKALVENNLFWKVSPFELGKETNIIADPAFVGEGNSMEKYALTEGSPAIDAGVELDGFTPKDGKTDIGALEYGEEPFKVGPYQEGYKPVNQFIFSGKDFDGNLPDWRDTIDSIVFFDCYMVYNIYTDQKDTLEEIMDESSLFYAQYEELNVIDSYALKEKTYRPQFVIKLKDGSYDGWASYAALEDVRMAYRTENTDIMRADPDGLIHVVNGGSTHFYADLLCGDISLASGGLGVSADAKIYHEKYTYHPMCDDDFWVVGENGRTFEDGDTLGFVFNSGEGIEYHVSVPESGIYDLYFLYAIWVDSNSPQDFFVDGQLIHSASLEPTGGYGGDDMKVYHIPVEIEAGNHDIRILNGGGTAVNYGAIILLNPENDQLDTFHMEQALIQFGDLEASDYDTEKWNSFQTIYQESEELLQTENLTQYQIERQFLRLLTAVRKMLVNYKYLEDIKVLTQPKLNYEENEALNLSELSVEVTYSDNSTAQISFADFEKYGITVNMADGTILTAENNGQAIKVSYYKYTAATDELSVDCKVAVDRTELSDLIEKAESINTEEYTQESVKTLKDAVAAAKAVLADETATQEQIDKQVDALEAAVEGLEKKDESSSSSETDESKPEESKPDDGASEEESFGEESGNSPATGDSNHMVAIWFVLLAASAMMAVRVVTQKNKFAGNK